MSKINYIFVLMSLFGLVFASPAMSRGGDSTVDGQYQTYKVTCGVTIASFILMPAGVSGTVTGFGPWSTWNQQQYCTEGVSSFCCAPKGSEENASTVPNNCTEGKAPCSNGTLLYCATSNVPAPWQFKEWAVGVGSAGSALTIVAVTALFWARCSSCANGISFI